MKVNWAVIAESSAVDQDTNNISLFHIIEDVNIPEPPESLQPVEDGDTLPVVALRFVIVAVFARTEEDTGEKKEVQLVVEMPNGNVAETGVIFEVDLETAHRNRTRVNVSTLPLAGQGEYRFQFRGLDNDERWRVMSETPLHVSYLAD